MKNARDILAAMVFVFAAVAPATADAFNIVSPRTEACHERLMLGSLGAAAEPFGGADAATQALRKRFLARVEARGVPDDEVTLAFIDEAAERYDLEDRPRPEQYVLASFVAGVRQPDTNGLSVVKFNETRSVHLQDQNQPLHVLRKTGHDYAQGNAQSIREARRIVVDRVERAVDSFRRPERMYAPTQWSFSFYEEVDVTMFAPAFELGRAAHVVQDAFAHTLRDEEMRVTSVANFVDVIQQQYDEPRDGPGHSDRLDECDAQESPFDHMRIVEAREATAGLLVAVETILEDEADGAAVADYLSAELDRVFALREGCTLANDYCDSDWKPIADSDLTEPYELTFCAVGSLGGAPFGGGALGWAGLVVSLFAYRWFKSRSRRSTA